MNEAGEYYTLERLEEDFQELRNMAPEPFLAQVTERVMAFSGSVPQADDVTAMVLRLTR